ncbi:sodium:solute symporter family protein [Telluribacter humicola]|uniref:sodium:solute symporter family protein n=1 Tax=Telluribacter humicola TaxID=1720261 RepID=UPI001A96781D|nr:sodium:solute symporter family protein [Telluribacter humicola]
MNQLQTIDYAAIVLYMIMVSGIGIYLGRYVKNINDYFKGGNSVSWVANGISNFMTMFSTSIFVAYAGIAYTHGLVALTVIWCSVPPSIFAALVLAKRWQRAGIISPVEFLETRFNAPVRQVLSWGGVGFKVLDEMIKLYAIGLFVAAATQIPLETAILSCGVVVLFYTVAGGLWAVVVTDVVQFIILGLTTIILLPLSIQAAGGFSNISQQLPEHLTFTNGPKGAPLYLMVYYVMVLIKFCGNWAFMQRFYSAESESDARKTGFLSASLFLLFPIVFLIPAIVARIIIPDLADPEMAYVSVCLRLLPTGLMGLMISAMFAATMSTLSAEYNVTASVITSDIYKRLFNPDATPVQLLWVGRLSTVALGLMVTLGALFVGGFGGAFEANKLFTGLFAIPMVVPLVFGILLRKPNPAGAIGSVVGGIIVGLLLNAFSSVRWEVATLIEIVTCFLIFWGSGFFKSQDPAYNQRVRAFFAKLERPVVKAKDRTVDAMHYVLRRLYAVALASTGTLFIILGMPSVEVYSGKIAMGVGVVCVLVAVYLFRVKQEQVRIIEEQKEHVS